MPICQRCLKSDDAIKSTGLVNYFFYKKCMHHSTNENDMIIILYYFKANAQQNGKNIQRLTSSIEITMCSEYEKTKCLACNINDADCLKLKVENCGCV